MTLIKYIVKNQGCGLGQQGRGLEGDRGSGGEGEGKVGGHHGVREARFITGGWRSSGSQYTKVAGRGEDLGYGDAEVLECSVAAFKAEVRLGKDQGEAERLVYKTVTMYGGGGVTTHMLGFEKSAFVCV